MTSVTQSTLEGSRTSPTYRDPPTGPEDDGKTRVEVSVLRRKRRLSSKGYLLGSQPNGQWDWVGVFGGRTK